MIQDGIQTLRQHQVCVNAKGQWAHDTRDLAHKLGKLLEDGQFQCFCLWPAQGQGFYPCRLRKLHPSGCENTVSSLLHLVIKTMLYTPCSCTLGGLFMTPINPQFLIYGHTILSDTLWYVRMLSTLVLRKRSTHTGVTFILPSHNKICDTHSDRRGGRLLGFKPWIHPWIDQQSQSDNEHVE